MLDKRIINMNNLTSLAKKQILPIGLILILALSRLVPHPWNFTPVIAVAIMSGYFFKNVYLSFLNTAYLYVNSRYIFRFL